MMGPAYVALWWREGPMPRLLSRRLRGGGAKTWMSIDDYRSGFHKKKNIILTRKIDCYR
jgi:hypothetical protein